MLIDELLEAENIENVAPEFMGRLKHTLRAAQKFELAPDFAVSAEELAMSFSGLANALPYVRLPFPLTWIEVAQAHRPRFMAAPLHVPDIQKLPKRVGFLMMQREEDPLSFVAYQFWTLIGVEIPQAGFVALNFDPKRAAEVPLDIQSAIFGEGEDVRRIFKLPASPEWQKTSPYVKSVMQIVTQPAKVPFADPILMDPRVAEFTIELGMVDWSGEITYLLAVLALLNTVNATEVERTDKTKLNAARAKAGKPPLAEHSILKIAPRLKRHIVGDSSAHGHRELRMHLARGHWKKRKTGIFFWRGHVRGRKGAPTDRRYLVE